MAAAAVSPLQYITHTHTYTYSTRTACAVGAGPSTRRYGPAAVRQPVRRSAAQMGGRGGRLLAGLPERHDRLQPPAAPVVRPAHVSGVRLRI